MKKLLLAIFVMCLSVIGCETPYTGPMLTVDHVDRYLHAVGGDTVCLQDGFDSVCIKVIPGAQGPRGPQGAQGPRGPQGSGHNEVVLVVADPRKISYVDLLKIFWENHDPTQGMRQGHDIGTQYRSGIYTYGDQQHSSAKESLEAYQQALRVAGYGEITTEILPASEFYYAESYHLQYLAKNPHGYCGLGGVGVACRTGLEES